MRVSAQESGKAKWRVRARWPTTIAPSCENGYERFVDRRPAGW